MDNPNIVNLFKEADELNRDEAVSLLKSFPQQGGISLAVDGARIGYIIPVNINEASPKDLARAEDELERPQRFILQPFEESLNAEMVQNQESYSHARVTRVLQRIKIVAAMGVGSMPFIRMAQDKPPFHNEKPVIRAIEFGVEALCILGVMSGITLYRRANRVLEQCVANAQSFSARLVENDEKRADLLARVKSRRDLLQP